MGLIVFFDRLKGVLQNIHEDLIELVNIANDLVPKVVLFLHLDLSLAVGMDDEKGGIEALV